MELTVSQIAKRIASDLDSADVARVTRQLRHWTMAGIIPTAGPVHAGPGRHRRYSGDALYIAAILVELARFQLPVGVLQSLAAGFRIFPNSPERADWRRLWNEAVEGTRIVHGAFKPSDIINPGKRTRSGKRAAVMTMYTPEDGGLMLEGDNTAKSVIIINLTRLFADLKD